MLKRLPHLQAILQVYAVIAVMFSGWTIIAFLWKLSAWLLLLNLGEIVTVFSYAMTANLLESLMILFLLLLLCFVLPAHMLRNDFVVRGTILSVGLIGSLMALIGFHMWTGIRSGAVLFAAPLSSILLTALLLWLASSARFMPAVRSAILWVSDRLMIFLFILLPLFLIFSAYVLFRNMG